jgi:hypothetical protein
MKLVRVQQYHQTCNSNKRVCICLGCLWIQTFSIVLGANLLWLAKFTTYT